MQYTRQSEPVRAEGPLWPDVAGTVGRRSKWPPRVRIPYLQSFGVLTVCWWNSDAHAWRAAIGGNRLLTTFGAANAEARADNRRLSSERHPGKTQHALVTAVPRQFAE